MKITYRQSIALVEMYGYEETVTKHIVEKTLEFKDGKVAFHSGGSGYQIAIDRVVKIEEE